MGIQGGRPSWQVQGSALVGVWGHRHHKAKVQEKLAIGNNAKPIKN